MSIEWIKTIFSQPRLRRCNSQEDFNKWMHDMMDWRIKMSEATIQDITASHEERKAGRLAVQDEDKVCGE